MWDSAASLMHWAEKCYGSGTSKTKEDVVATVDADKLSSAHKNISDVVYSAIRSYVNSLTSMKMRELATESYLPENQGLPA